MIVGMAEYERRTERDERLKRGLTIRPTRKRTAGYAWL